MTPERLEAGSRVGAWAAPEGARCVLPPSERPAVCGELW